MSLQLISFKKNRPYLLLLLLAAVILLMVFLAKCSHNSSGPWLQMPDVKSGGDTIDVAIEISPLSYRVSGDSIVGVDYEILQGISRMTGRPVKFHVFAPFEEAVEGLEAGTYDIIISSLPSTESLKSRFNVSMPVYLDREVLVQRADSSGHIDRPDELDNDTVWIPEGSPFRDRIENLSSEIGRPIYIETIPGCTAEYLVILVSTGDIPRAVVNSGLARRMKNEFYPELDISTPISFTQFQCWLLSDRDSVMSDSINQWLGRFQATEEYRDIISKYGLQSLR